MSSAQTAELDRFVAESLASGEEHRERALPSGGRLVFDRAPLPGVTHEVTQRRADGAVAVRQRCFAPSDAPAPAYPTDSPFVADRAVTVVYFGATPTPLLSWEPVDDPGSLASELVAMSRRQGWAEPADARPALARLALGALSEFATIASEREFSLHALVRGGVRRLIQAAGFRRGAGIVTLFELPSAAGRAEPYDATP